MHSLRFDCITVLYCNRWKDPNNEFRINAKFKLTEIPTIVDYGTVSTLIKMRIVQNVCKSHVKQEQVFQLYGPFV